VEFESLNAADGGEGARRWREAGEPVVPTLVVDGQATPVLHVSQIADALGLPPPPAEPASREGADAATILGAWIDGLGEAEWEAVLRPTPARGRTLRNLTVNVFHPFELLPEAWSSGDFAWHPEDDGVREKRLATRDDLLAFAQKAAAGWQSFLGRDDVDVHDPLVASPRGPVRFSALVSFQRWHAAYHHRQLAAVLGRDSIVFDDLVLPREVF
jgi:hypothetical protein